MALVPCFATACGGSGAETTPAQTNALAPKADPPATSAAAAACVTFFHRQRDCTDTFLPALVDLRVKLDIPAGIAASAQSDGRDAIIAQAHKEWQTDSMDDAIVATCNRMAQDMAAAPDVAQQIDESNRCAAQAACGDFLGCAMPFIQRQLVARAQTQSPPTQ